MKRPRMDVNLEELDQIIERGTHAPLSTSEGEKLKQALHALAGMLPQPRSTEKTKNVCNSSAGPIYWAIVRRSAYGGDDRQWRQRDRPGY